MVHDWYTIIDDWSQALVVPQLPRGLGKRPTLSDSDGLTLALWAQWWRRSVRALVRSALEHWRASFPRLHSQRAYHRRSRRLAGVLTRVGALNLGIWLNRLFGRPDLALATLFAASMANRHHPSEERDIARVISTPVSDHQHGPSGWEPTAVTVACGFYPTRPISGPCDGHAGEIVGMLVKTSRYAP
jgi:hypothetical protein